MTLIVGPVGQCQHRDKRTTAAGKLIPHKLRSVHAQNYAALARAGLVPFRFAVPCALFSFGLTGDIGVRLALAKTLAWTQRSNSSSIQPVVFSEILTGRGKVGSSRVHRQMLGTEASNFRATDRTRSKFIAFLPKLARLEKPYGANLGCWKREVTPVNSA